MKISGGPELKLLVWICIGGYAFVHTTGPLRAGDSTVRIAGPLVISGNPNYFQDANGQALILNGSQTWNTFQDWGSKGTLEPLGFDAFVTFLSAHGHNFTLLWITEMPKFCGFPATASSPLDLTAGPLPWLRTGPGNATDSPGA